MSDFIILGLANCFIRDEENQLQPVQVIEPIPSSAFLTLLQRGPSSYSTLKAFQYQEVQNILAKDAGTLGFPSEAILGSDFQERLEAAARTYQHDPDAATKLEVGQSIDLDNPSPHKRILNPKRSVKATDNIKQHSHATQIL